MSKISQNLKENFMGSVPGKIAVGALAFTAAFLPMTGKLGNTFDATANAQDKAIPTSHMPLQSRPNENMSAWDKAMAAQDFSKTNPGVGVFVNFAAVPELAPERLIKAIEANFANKGIPVDIRTNISRGNLTTVTFFLDGTPFGGPSGNGYFLDEIPSGFNTVVKAFQQEQTKKAAPAELHSAIR